MGISTHSEPSTIYIISTWSNGKANPLGDDSVRRVLNGRNAKFCEIFGTYKGVMERSFCITEGMDESTLIAIAKLHGQECILKLTNHKHGIRKAYFLTWRFQGAEFVKKPFTYRPVQETFAGYFRSLPLAVISKAGQDYSFNPEYPDTYYSIWPTDTTVMQELDKEFKAVLKAA